MEFAAIGADALSDKNFPFALTFYTKALIEHPSSPDYFTQRSIAFTRISPPRPDLALKDAEYAVLLGQKRAKREKIQAGQQRRVVALHGLGRYADAKAVLETTVRWRPVDSRPAKMEVDMWMARIENKMKTVSEVEKVSTEKEQPTTELPSETEMKEWLKSQLDENDSFIFPETPPVTYPALKNVAIPGTVSGESVASILGISGDDPRLTQSAAAKIRHEWYQSPQTVTITLYAKSVSKIACEIDIQEDSVNVSFPQPANPSSTYTFNLDPLFALIDPSQSKGTVLSTKVELTLKKAQAGQKWHNLEGAAPLKDNSNKQSTTHTADDAAKAAVLSTLSNPTSNTTDPSQAYIKVPGYPTSSRTGPKNWDKLANDLSAKPSKTKTTTKSKSDDPTAKDGSPASDVEDDDGYDSDFGGGDAVDGFFKKLYAGADPDTQRAMMKSFTESNGTSLSTNWKDVGSKKVEEVKSSKD